jgi:CBS domain-containing protein
MSEFEDEYSETLDSDFKKLEGALLNDTVRLLAPSEPIRLDADATVHDAIEHMVAQHRAAVVVIDRDGRLIGIFTERDVLRLTGEGRDLGGVAVGEVMTQGVVTIGPEDDVFAAARVMGEKRIRHLPVVQDGNVLGVVGIRDVMRSLVERIWRVHDDDARATARELLRRA